MMDALVTHLASDDPQLLSSIRGAEGLMLKAYADPKTGKAPWTIGFGHTGPEVGPNSRCTGAQAESWLRSDVADAISCLDAGEPWWRTMSLNRQRVFAELCFNIGLGGLRSFHRMLAFAEQGQWGSAAHELLNSQWSADVGPSRAHRLARELAAA